MLAAPGDRGPDRLAGPFARLTLCAAAMVVGTVGCVGPRGLELTRLRYDQAVHATSDQLWLRNLVRLRYGERPSFLDVAAINSQLELTTRGLTGGQERDSANATLFGDLSMQFRDAPTLSYIPRAETELTRAVVSPVGVSALALMANTGWREEDVLRVMVAEANGLKNAPGSEDLIPERVPEESGFREAASLVSRLRAAGAGRLAKSHVPEEVGGPIDADRVDGSDLVAAASEKLAFRAAGHAGGLVLTRDEPGNLLFIEPHASGDPEVRRFRATLNLSPEHLTYPIRRAERTNVDPIRPLADGEDAVIVRTRSILEMMIYLSKGVEVPAEHVASGVAARTIGPDGTVFDWTGVTCDLFRVRACKKRPKGTAAAVEYRGYWYYLEDTDQRSKSTLSLIQALLDIQLTEPQGAGPLLTLPVGL